MRTQSGAHMTQAIPSSPSVNMHGYHGKPALKPLPPFLSPCLLCSLSLSSCLSIYLFLPLTISLSLHLLFPFLNLRGACEYSIFIILGGTVDRWDTCTITRAQHYLFQADRVKTHSLSSRSLSRSSERGILYYEDSSYSGQEVQFRPINKESLKLNNPHNRKHFPMWQ